MIWYFLIIVALIYLIFASITDIKTREVPNWLNYSLIAIGLGSRAIYSIITQDKSYLIYGLIGLGIFFIIANIMYYAKQWGGGDAKLLIGMGAMFGNYEGIKYLNPVFDLPFILILIINILVAGAIWGIVYSTYLAIMNNKEFVKNIKENTHKNFIYLIIIGIIIIILSLIINNEFRFLIFILGITLSLLPSTYIFFKSVEKSSMYKKVNIERLTEGDWIAEDIKKGNKIICSSIKNKNQYEINDNKKKINKFFNKIKYLPFKKYLLKFLITRAEKSINYGLTKDDIKRLKDNKIKVVIIKDGLPFVPGFLIGFIFTLVYGSLFAVFRVFF
ncbi:prepilin peptidase [Candidatus Woesearchaeota archaeon]|nr:prepilin peptidase [Candidatus Woesearchaeota archaeon]HIH25177.1 prepilin peptidase [Nanoarchaeota archaeon]